MILSTASCSLISMVWKNHIHLNIHLNIITTQYNVVVNLASEIRKSNHIQRLQRRSTMDTCVRTIT